MDNRNSALVVVDLYKYFGLDAVLKGISLEAHEGDIIAMVGASGSGKSTFLRCINLLETPTSGEVYVRGELVRMKKNSSGVTVPEDIKQIERICSLEEAQIEWKKRNNSAARRLLEQYKTSGLKWFLAYYLTWFPYNWFQKLKRWRGATLPK